MFTRTFTTLALSTFALAACTESEDAVVDGSSSARMEYTASGDTFDVTILPASEAQKQGFNATDAVNEVIITIGDDGVQERMAFCAPGLVDENGLCTVFCIRTDGVIFIVQSGGGFCYGE